MQINDRFGAAAAFETVSLPDGTEAAVPTEHAAAVIIMADMAPIFFLVRPWQLC